MSELPADPFALVASNPDVAEAVSVARAALDPLLLDRKLRTHGAQLAARAALQNAHASATLEGAEVPIDELSGGSVASPVLRVAAGSLEVQTALRTLAGWPARQVWAQLATIAGREYLSEDQRGRPRGAAEQLHDPLHLQRVHEPEDVTIRMALLAELLQQPTHAPALVVASIAHAELVALQPFAAGNGVVARAFFHHVLAERGVDPDYFAMTDVGLASLGRASYVRAIQAYDAGGDGVIAWCVHLSRAFERGALLTRETLQNL